MKNLVHELEQENLREKKYAFEVGDTVEVHYLIREVGEEKGKPKIKERIQVFKGTVITRKHGGVQETFTVRRIVAGEGVERVFPLNSPRIHDIKVTRHGKVRRAKLYYLRDRIGKATRVKERRVMTKKGAKKKARKAAQPNNPKVSAASAAAENGAASAEEVQ